MQGWVSLRFFPVHILVIELKIELISTQQESL